MSEQPINTTNSKNEVNSSYEHLFNNQVFDYVKIQLKNVGLSDENDTKLKHALNFFATGECTNQNHILEITKYLVTIALHFIKFPVGEDLSKIQQEFYQLSQSVNSEFGFPNIIGVIDCDYIKFASEEFGEEYKNPNSEYSINAQFVCGPDLQLYNVLAAFPGQFDNMQIWKNSKLRKQLEQQDGDHKYWLIGNSKYIQDSSLMVPILKAETEPEQLYNQSHAVIYKRIQHALILLKTRFKCLDTVLTFSPDEVCGVTIACCVLHNMCVLHDDTVNARIVQNLEVNDQGENGAASNVENE